MQSREKIVALNEVEVLSCKIYSLSDWESYITDSRFNFSFKRDLVDEERWPSIIKINGGDTGIVFIDNNDFPAREFVNKGQNYRKFYYHFRGYDLYARFDNYEQVQTTLNEITPYLRTPEIARYIKSFYEKKFILNKKGICMLHKLISYIKENYDFEMGGEKNIRRMIVDDKNETFLAHFAEEHPKEYQSACIAALTQTESEIEELVRLVGINSYSGLRHIFQSNEAKEIYESGFTSLSFLLEEQKKYGSFFGFDRLTLGCFAVHTFLDLINTHKSHLINSKLTFKEVLEKHAPNRSSKADFDYATVLFSIKMDILFYSHLNTNTLFEKVDKQKNQIETTLSTGKKKPTINDYPKIDTRRYWPVTTEFHKQNMFTQLNNNLTKKEEQKSERSDKDLRDLVQKAYKEMCYQTESIPSNIKQRRK